MELQDSYPVIVTDRLADCRDFYVRHFGFTAGFEASWFVWMQSAPAADGRRFALAFMDKGHPSRPPGPETFGGLGAFLTFQVADAAEAYGRLCAEGVAIHHPLTVEPWGQRRFMVRDPAGMLIDVVEMTTPEPGFWERYPAA